MGIDGGKSPPPPPPGSISGEFQKPRGLRVPARSADRNNRAHSRGIQQRYGDLEIREGSSMIVIHGAAKLATNEHMLCMRRAALFTNHPRAMHSASKK